MAEFASDPNMRLIYNRRRFVPTLGLLLVASLCMVIGHAVRVSADQSTGGITISPYIEQLSLSKNQTTASYTITVTNNSDSLELIHLKTVDFTNLNEHGEIGFLTPTQTKRDPYSLVNNVSFAYPELAIGPHQTNTVPIQIINAEKLASGGHFGAILFSINNPEAGSGTSVTVNQDSASLLFLSTTGAGTQALSLATPLINNFYASLPTTVNAVFTNTGNTQTIPYGLAQLTNDKGDVVAQGQLNTNSSLILPESKRLFMIYLRPTTNHLPPGKYHLAFKYRTDNQAGFTVYQQTFLMVNQSYILSAIGLFFAIMLLTKYHREWLPKRLFRRRKKAKQKKQITDYVPTTRTINVVYEDEEAIKIR